MVCLQGAGRQFKARESQTWRLKRPAMVQCPEFSASPLYGAADCVGTIVGRPPQDGKQQCVTPAPLSGAPVTTREYNDIVKSTLEGF